ncbi:hypothetical protein ACFL0U_03540, partial [Pseudomonadota bacterium]
VFFLPCYEKGVLQKGKCEIRVLKSEAEIIALYNEFGILGYRMPVHEEWGWERVAPGREEGRKRRKSVFDKVAAKAKGAGTLTRSRSRYRQYVWQKKKEKTESKKVQSSGGIGI